SSQSRFVRRRLAQSKNPFGRDACLDALVTSVSNWRYLFFRRRGQAFAGLVPWRTDANGNGAQQQCADHRPFLSGGMGGLRDELRGIVIRSLNRPASTLASDSGGRILHGTGLSSHQRALV